MNRSIGRVPQFVVKISKFCNLRCTYCYEFPYLGDRRRMSLHDVRAMLTNIANSIEALEIEEADLIWHGGEPLLVPLEFYEQIGQIEDELFGSRISYRNALQTNLTVLTDNHITFLKRGFFSDIGVSFDVYGDQRVDIKGRQRTEIVLANMDKLVDHDIDFSAIAVLARDTLIHIEDIYRFYDEIGIHHRILPYYRTADSVQAQRHGLDFEELVQAFKKLFHLWLASENATPVRPIDDYLQFAIRYIASDRIEPFNRAEDERVFIVDVNGGVYSDVESYDPEYCYGNLFRAPLSEIITSDPRRRSNVLSAERMRRFCHPCRYFGYCPGAFVANATTEQRKLLETRGCPVRAVIDHIVEVFERTDLKGAILKSYAQVRPEPHPALNIA